MPVEQTSSFLIDSVYVSSWQRMSESSNNDAIAARNKAKQKLWMIQEQRRNQQKEYDEDPDPPSANYPQGAICPVCYEVMNTPERAPMTLFPCGHSICLNCLSLYESSAVQKKCCLCSQPYTKSARNITLMNVIDSSEPLFKPRHLLSSDVDTAKARLEIFSSQLKTAHERNEALRQRLAAENEEMANLDAEISFIKSERDKSTETVGHLEREQQILSEEREKLREEILASSTELEKLRLLVEASQMASS